jgi:hypothetical protein
MSLVTPHAWTAGDDATSTAMQTLTDGITQLQGGTPSGSGTALDFFRAVQSVAQTGLTISTFVSVTFSTEAIDSAGGHSTSSNTRQNGKNAVIEIRELGMVVLGDPRALRHGRARREDPAHRARGQDRPQGVQAAPHFFGDSANDPDARYPELNALVVEVRKTNGQEAIVLSNGGSIEFVARSKGSGRGFTVDVLVLDEAQALASLIPELEDAGFDVIKVGGPERAMACGHFYDLASTAGMSHNGDPALASAVAAARWKDVGEGARVFTRRQSAGNIAALYAALLALHGMGVARVSDPGVYLI